MLVWVAKPISQPSGSPPARAVTMNIGYSRFPTSALKVSSTLNGPLDQAGGLRGGVKDLVRVLEPEAREVVEQVVAVGEREVDALHGRDALQHRLPHVVQGELDRWAVVVGERREDRVAHLRPRGLGRLAVVLPARGDDRGEDAVVGLGQRRVLLAVEAGPARAGRAQDQQILDAALVADVRAADGGDPHAAAATLKRVRAEARPRVLGDPHARGADRRAGLEKAL